MKLFISFPPILKAVFCSAIIFTTSNCTVEPTDPRDAFVGTYSGTFDTYCIDIFGIISDFPQKAAVAQVSKASDLNQIAIVLNGKSPFNMILNGSQLTAVSGTTNGTITESTLNLSEIESTPDYTCHYQFSGAK